MELKGKRALITGAAGVVGQVLSARFTSLGVKVIGADLNEKSLEEMARLGHLEDHNHGDLSNPKTRQKIISCYAEKTDILVNCIGYGGNPHLLSMADDKMVKNLMRINFETPAAFCRGFAPAMAKKGGGKIINVSSALTAHPLPTISYYVASKAALETFTKSIALEFAPHNVQINCIAPGYHGEEKHGAYFETEEGKNFIKENIPAGKIGDINGLVESFIFLSGRGGDNITGQVITIDGGYGVGKQSIKYLPSSYLRQPKS